MKNKIRNLKNWDNKTWLSSLAYINSFNTFLLKKKKLNQNSNKLDIFFDSNSFLLSRWKTTDAYSNEVDFLIKNIETNIPIKNKTFRIPREEDL